MFWIHEGENTRIKQDNHYPEVKFNQKQHHAHNFNKKSLHLASSLVPLLPHKRAMLHCILDAKIFVRVISQKDLTFSYISFGSIFNQLILLGAISCLNWLSSRRNIRLPVSSLCFSFSFISCHVVIFSFCFFSVNSNFACIA